MKPSRPLKKSLASVCLYTLSTVGIIAGHAVISHAETASVPTVQSVSTEYDIKVEGNFVRKSKRLKGGYSVVQENGRTIIRFADNFKTVNGPDLKVFLSPQSIQNASGQTATQGAVLLGFVKSNKGTQDYIVPSGVNLTNFSSILVHCEAYSVLWGGGNI